MPASICEPRQTSTLARRITTAIPSRRPPTSALIRISSRWCAQIAIHAPSAVKQRPGLPTAFFRQCPTSQLAPQVLAIQLEEVEGIIEEDMLARRLAPQLLEHRKPVLIAGDRLAIDQAGTHLEPVNGFDDERYPLHERSGWRCEGLALLHDVSAQNSDLDVAGFLARMGGFGRNVECIANLDHASRLPLDG